MTTLAPEAIDESLDPRDPLLRLSRFFDDGSIELLHERDRSGVLAAGGTVNGLRTIAFATDGTVMGGAMGLEGCTHIVNAYDTAIEEQSPIVGIWHSGGARLAEITTGDLQRFVDRLRGERLDPSTIRNAVTPLRAIYRWAITRGLGVAVVGHDDVA